MKANLLYSLAAFALMAGLTLGGVSCGGSSESFSTGDSKTPFEVSFRHVNPADQHYGKFGNYQHVSEQQKFFKDWGTYSGFWNGVEVEAYDRYGNPIPWLSKLQSVEFKYEYVAAAFWGDQPDGCYVQQIEKLTYDPSSRTLTVQYSRTRSAATPGGRSRQVDDLTGRDVNPGRACSFGENWPGDVVAFPKLAIDHVIWEQDPVLAPIPTY